MGDRLIYSVDIKTNTAVCRLCGGRGQDPYSYGQSCRKCGGRKRVPTAAANAAQRAWTKWKADNAERIAAADDMQPIMHEAVEFISGLRGATADIIWAKEA